MRRMMNLSFTTDSRSFVTLAAVGLLAFAIHIKANAEPSAAQRISAGNAAKNVHYFSIGEVPLDGGYDELLGLVKITAPGKNDSSPFTDKELRKMWGLSSPKPIEVDGVSWSGDPLRIRITGTKSNEFGPLFDF